MSKQFTEKGFLIKRNFLNTNIKKKLQSTFLIIFQKYISASFKDFEDPKLHEKLWHLRKNNPKKFGDFYDELKLNANINSIFYSDKFLDLFAKTLNTNKESLFINGHMIRLDPPNDVRNNLDWHQDCNYYMQTYPKFNAGVCWVALTSNSKANGTLQYLTKSHKNYLGTKSKNSKRGLNNSKQYSIPIDGSKTVQNFESIIGDIGLFHMNLIHRSGENISNKFRISMACRFHDMSNSFNIGVQKYIFNKTRSNRLIPDNKDSKYIKKNKIYT